MSETELPEGWVWVRLADVISEPLVNGRSVRSFDGGFPVLRLTAIANGCINLAESKTGAWTAKEAAPYCVTEGDFLLSRGNGSIKLVGRGGLVGPVTKAVAFPDTMIRVRVDSRVLLPGYLRLLWESPSVRQQIESQARTTAGIHKVNQTILESIRFPLPPLAEQRRIVEALEAHLSRLDAATRLTEQSAMRLRRLHSAVTDITHGYRITNSDHFDDSTHFSSDPDSIDGDLPQVPRDWEWKRLRDIADVVGGVTKDKKKQSDPDFPETPYLRVANVQRGHLNLANIAYIRVPPEKVKQLRLLPGDVLLNEGGDRDKLGRGWIWEGQIDGAIHQNHVFRARIRDDILKPKLLSYYANRAGHWFDINGKQSTNLASISLRKIKAFPVPIPPADVQEQILERIEDQTAKLANAGKSVKMARARAAALRKALLRRAFTGGLVPQDPADEPASALLARIRAERTAQPKPKRVRRASAPRTAAGAMAAVPAPPHHTPAPTASVQQEFAL